MDKNDPSLLKKQFADRLNAACDNAGLPALNMGRQVQLAKLLKVSQQAARNWLCGISLPRHEKLVQISITLKVRVEWLQYGGEWPLKQQDTTNLKTIPRLETVQLKPVPLLSLTNIQSAQSKSDLLFFLQNKKAALRNEVMTYMGGVASQCLSLYMQDDSMHPRYNSKSRLIIDLSLSPKPGLNVLCKLPNNAVTIRQYREAAAGYYLTPSNPVHAEYLISNDPQHSCIFGVVVELYVSEL